ncbi:hypothetical protein MMC27_003925 [Xylographa pallens]|nr:hypothetical protein [Xylographa pallens]
MSTPGSALTNATGILDQTLKQLGLDIGNPPIFGQILEAVQTEVSSFHQMQATAFAELQKSRKQKQLQLKHFELNIGQQQATQDALQLQSQNSEQQHDQTKQKDMEDLDEKRQKIQKEREDLESQKNKARKLLSQRNKDLHNWNASYDLMKKQAEVEIQTATDKYISEEDASRQRLEAEQYN